MRIRGTAPAILLLLTIAGCEGKPDEPGTVAPVAGLGENEIWIAETMYEDQTCAMCHGADAEGTSLGPALRKLTPYWNEERLSAYLQDPEAFARLHPDFDERRTENYSMKMPAFDGLDDSDRRLLARWLLSREP